MSTGAIRAGIGGWTFEPWRGVFYPDGLKQADELAYAASKLSTIEINGTYYSTFKPDSFAKWAAAVPDGFIFSVKASRFCTNRKVLADVGASSDKFFGQGLDQLGDHLGPILWQFMGFKRFEKDDFGKFLDGLPREVGGVPLKHVMEPRHESFRDPAFAQLCRDQNVGIVLADHEKYPMFADVTSDFVYMRLQQGSDDVATAYEDEPLTEWADRAATYAQGGVPGGLAMADPAFAPTKVKRDVFVYFIHEGKIRAPAAAMAFLDKTREAAR